MGWAELDRVKYGVDKSVVDHRGKKDEMDEDDNIKVEKLHQRIYQYPLVIKWSMENLPRLTII